MMLLTVFFRPTFVPVLCSIKSDLLPRQSVDPATYKSQDTSFKPALEEVIQHKTEQVLSADDFLLLKQKLEKSRNQVANLEKEICEGGELTKGEISPLWSNISHSQNNQ